MEFFCYHRDRPGSVALRDKLVEEHWSYMDRYAAEMIARGPTFGGDGETPTGSVHIVGLPDPAAARAFAFDEPNYQAGVYRDVLLRRWRNMLGRTMWDFPGGRMAEPLSAFDRSGPWESQGGVPLCDEKNGPASPKTVMLWRCEMVQLRHLTREKASARSEVNPRRTSGADHLGHPCGTHATATTMSTRTVHAV
ncbi:YciI family protein [Streptomyces sp. NBC_01236]|uniref:YciI family protein n=1 Tax=Streptomyces sp. NBC_01236 TaxID=2903789 RepID=UPI002E16308A|nr:YciI family protein [Streptomyces sp. NBC_01236]